ncbi:MAG: TrbC/VirB2 family protein [Clostridia bacterium]|nr:TrbC/VirB2 family protein [Clostridia bacterium]
MKKTTKVIFSIILVSIIIMANIIPVLAATGAIDPSGIKGTATNTERMENIGGQIVTIVSVAGSIIAVVVLIVLGIKYMMGSAEEKAEYKKTLLPYIIGAGFVFAASALAGIVYTFAQSIGNK